MPLLWASGDVCPGFQSQSGFPHLWAFSPAHSDFHRFTCGVTPTDLLVASMATDLFHPHTCVQPLVGLDSRIKCASTSQQ